MLCYCSHALHFLIRAILCSFTCWPNVHSATHCRRDRQLLFTSQVECSLIAVPEYLVKAEADADIYGGECPVYGLCPVADIWQDYSNCEQIFWWMQSGRGGRSPMFVDQGFGVLVKSPGLWRQAPSPHLCLAGILLLPLYSSTPNICMLCWSQNAMVFQIPTVHFELG